MSKISPENFITIQGWMREQLDLKGNDLMVFAIIYGFSQTDNQKFTGSLQYLADWCGATKQGIISNLKKLIDAGLIVKEQVGVNSVYYSTKVTCKLSLPEVSTEFTDNRKSCKHSLLNNIVDSNIKDRNKIKEEDIPENCESKTFVDLYNEICINLPKCLKASDKRAKAIRNITKKYTLDEIKEALTKANESDFLTGKNDRNWKADIDFILREDKFINILEDKYAGKQRVSSKAGSDVGLHLDRSSQKNKFREDIKNGKAEKF